MTDEKRSGSLDDASLELLDLVLEEEGLEGREPTIPRADRSPPLPLSLAQERLWFIDQLEGSVAFHMSDAHRLMGPLNVSALKAALGEMARRHEVLRSTYPSADGKPFQVIHPPGEVQLPVADLTGLSETARETEAVRLALEHARRPFDLAKDLLLRHTLFRLGASRHILLANIHHIVSDGWSMGVIHRELGALYTAFLDGKPSPFPDLPVQYTDYAIWQRQRLQGEELEQQISYWREQLAGAPPLELPTDRLRPPEQDHSGALVEHRLDGELVDGLRKLSQGQRATLFMTLLAAFKVLLSRHAGQADLSVGTPIAGRDHVELEGLVGFFLSTLVVRTDLDGDPTFTDLLRRVRETCLGAYSHQDLPFEKLLTELQPSRELSRTPLFQVFFNMVTVPEEDLSFGGLTAEPFATGNVESKFDITLYLSEEDEGLLLSLVYKTALFDAARLEEMLRQLEHLLRQIVDNPERPIGDYSLLTEEARRVVPDPLEPMPPTWEGTVSQRVSRWANETPDRLAVVGGDASWTYAQLDRASDGLASFLGAAGIGPEDVVAVYAARDPSLVWALLGIEKAGAAFMMLDPAYPEARLIDFLEAVSPRGLIELAAAGPVPGTVSRHVEAASLRCRLELPRHPDQAPEGHPLNTPGRAPDVTIAPNHLQHVAVTSGTMGRPKAIGSPHLGMSQSLRWFVGEFGLEESDRFGMLSGLTFQPLLRETFSPLWVGATLFVPRPSDFEEPERLLAWLQQEKISVAQLTPAMLQLLTSREETQVVLRSLRNVTFTGDVLRQRDVERLKQLAPNAVCVNFYGVSEKIGPGSYQVVGQDDAADVSRVSIGRGIEGVQLLLLTRGNRQAGMGEVGEICLRTPYLARGYIGNEELTRKHFTVNPLTGLEDDRIYRTGDLGRYSSDGRIEYVNRADDQVQIRGFRVEIDEVRGVLEHHPAIHDAAVVASEDDSGDRRLVAYVVAESGAEVDVTALQQHMREKVPGYMIPSVFLKLDTLPITPRGKLDRAALPPPDWSRTIKAKDHVAPRNPIEEAVAEIWSEVLKVERVGAFDDFFDLGGHSLLATQVVVRIQDTFGVGVEVRTLFESSTLDGLSAEVVRRLEQELGREALDELMGEMGVDGD